MNKIIDLLRRVNEIAEVSEIERRIIVDATVTLFGYRSPKQ
jgi:hypothetical protein